MTNNVNHPQHSIRREIETTIKYLDRALYKNNTLEDLKIARWYLNCAIDKLEVDKWN